MLRPLKAAPKRRQYSVYDLEWIPASNQKKAESLGFTPLQLRVVGTFDGQRYRAYKTVQEFLNAEFTTRNSGRWWFAHAGGLADINFVLEYLIENDRRSNVRIDAAFSGSSAIIVKITKGRHHWTLCDSYWLIRQPLRKIGEWMGLAKGGEEGSTDTFYKPFGELLDYNKRDCELLWNALYTFEAVLNGLGAQMQKTIASTAMDLFRRHYLRDEIRTVPMINEIARHAYVASRVEVYRRDVHEADYYDINSSFPFSMTYEQPGNFVGSQRGLPSRGLYLAELTIEVEDQNIPPLPVRSPADDRIYFPTGQWRGWFDVADVELLEETRGRIIHVHDVLTFDPFDDMAAYAEEIYDMRRRSTDSAEKIVLKFLLNSLYGKFAECTLKQRICINPPPKFFDIPEATADTPGRTYLMPGVWSLTEERYIAHEHVPVAVHITALSRAAVTRFMGHASDVFYVDTDGFACPTGDRVPTGDALGELKLEKHIRDAVFAAPKLYAYRESEEGQYTIKAKGFTKVRGGPDENGIWRVEDEDESRRLNYADFCRIIEHQDVYVESFARVRSSLRKGTPGPSESTTSKRWHDRVRPKRAPLADGGSRPWHILELKRPWPPPNSPNAS